MADEKERKHKHKHEIKEEPTPSAPAIVEETGPKVVGERFSMATDSLTGEVHFFGDVPENLATMLEKFVTDNKGALNSKLQFLPAGPQDCMITKIDSPLFFRCHVHVAKILLRDGWQVLSATSAGNSHMTFWHKP